MASEIFFGGISKPESPFVNPMLSDRNVGCCSPPLLVNTHSNGYGILQVLDEYMNFINVMKYK